MNLRRFCTSLAIALMATATATAAHAAIHRVHPGESIQDAIDGASAGDTILVFPGTYQEDPNSLYGLHVTVDNLRLIGLARRFQGEAGKVRLLHNGAQETGIFAAPPGCGYKDGACGDELQGFYVRGFTVEGFPVNGIQTRWVNGFQFIRNESVNNLNNGIYPTLSANGLVSSNVSYGSLDTSLWVAGSENVRVIGNDLSGSPIGFEITVSNNVLAAFNNVYNNTVGFGLFHPNAAGNPPLPVMARWLVAYNNVHDNNLPNPAPPQSFQAGVPPGVGILALGVSDHLIFGNLVTNNGFVGIGILEWCTAVAVGDPNRNCNNDPPVTASTSDNNWVSLNWLRDNGLASPPPLPLPAADLFYLDLTQQSSGNCFENNVFDTHYSGQQDGELPTDGC